MFRLLGGKEMVRQGVIWGEEGKETGKVLRDCFGVEKFLGMGKRVEAVWG